MLETREEAAHYELGDERIQMAFSSANAAASGSRSMSVTPPDLSPSASYPPPDTPKLHSQRRGAEGSLGEPSESPRVSTVTKNLENLGFGSPA